MTGINAAMTNVVYSEAMAARSDGQVVVRYRC